MEARLAYSVREVATALSVSERTVWRWIKAGDVQALRIGGCVRVPLGELQRILSSSAQIKPRPQEDPETDKWLRNIARKMAV